MKLEDRPTPETDAAEDRYGNGNSLHAHCHDSSHLNGDFADFARNLACERDEARSQRDRLLEALEDTKPLLIGIESDLGEPLYRRERAKRLLRAFESALTGAKGAK